MRDVGSLEAPVAGASFQKRVVMAPPIGRRAAWARAAGQGFGARPRPLQSRFQLFPRPMTRNPMIAFWSRAFQRRVATQRQWVDLYSRELKALEDALTPGGGAYGASGRWGGGGLRPWAGLWGNAAATPYAAFDASSEIPADSSPVTSDIPPDPADVPPPHDTTEDDDSPPGAGA